MLSPLLRIARRNAKNDSGSAGVVGLGGVNKAGARIGSEVLKVGRLRGARGHGHRLQGPRLRSQHLASRSTSGFEVNIWLRSQHLARRLLMGILARDRPDGNEIRKGVNA